MGYLGTYSDDRQPALERLMLQPARRLEGWAIFRRRIPLSRSISCGRPTWSASIISLPPPIGRSTTRNLTLNVTRADMVRAGYSPSVRLFEAAACGTPIISDAGRALPRSSSLAQRFSLRVTPRDVLAILRDIPEAEVSRDWRRGRGAACSPSIRRHIAPPSWRRSSTNGSPSGGNDSPHRA